MWEEFHHWLLYKLDHMNESDKIKNIKNFQDFSNSIAFSIQSNIFDSSNPKVQACVSKLYELTNEAFDGLKKLLEEDPEQKLLNESQLNEIKSPR